MTTIRKITEQVTLSVYYKSKTGNKNVFKYLN